MLSSAVARTHDWTDESCADGLAHDRADAHADGLAHDAHTDDLAHGLTYEHGYNRGETRHASRR